MRRSTIAEYVVTTDTDGPFPISRPLVTAFRVLPFEVVAELAAPGDGSDPNLHRAPWRGHSSANRRVVRHGPRSAWTAEAATVALTNQPFS